MRNSQSNHSGIETSEHYAKNDSRLRSQSNHSGIETTWNTVKGECFHTPNRTIVELKLH